MERLALRRGRERGDDSREEIRRLQAERPADYAASNGTRGDADFKEDAERAHRTAALVGRYDGVIGVKTGTTWRAGNCVVALAEKDGVRVLVVLLAARDRWFSAASLLDRAFEVRRP